MKFKLYSTCVLPVFLYSSESLAVTKADARRINALHQWCLRMLLAFNDEVQCRTNQPAITEIIQA